MAYLFNFFIGLTETPSHACVEFPIAAIRTVESSFEFKPQTSIVTPFSRDDGTCVIPSL